jgi:glutamyl-tRNA synthetase
VERRAWFGAVIDLLRPRARRLQDFVEKGRLFFEPAVTYDAAAVQKHLTPDMTGHLRSLHDAYVELPAFTRDALESSLRAVAFGADIKPGALIHAARVAVTGSTVSPGLFETFELIGRDRVLGRLLTSAGTPQ